VKQRRRREHDRKVWRRFKENAAGKREEFGAYHCRVNGRPVNLRTDDEQLAKQRMREAIKGARDWPRKMSLEERRAPGLRALAVVGTQPPAPVTFSIVAPDPAPANGINPQRVEQSEPPASSPPAPAAAAPEVIEPEPIPAAPAAAAAGWADDVNQAAGATSSPAAGGDASPAIPGSGMKFSDLPWFSGALVTASKLAVGAQVKLQGWAIRWLGDVEAGRVGPPPAPAPATEETFATFSRKLSTPWGDEDPRELGRQVYEGVLRRLCPDELPIPDYVLAPVLVLITTLPVQLAGATKIKRDATTDAAPAAAAGEATPDARAAA
jgi:hypothetical protein